MIVRCPNCKFEYEVESNGKYLCGVCGRKFFFFLDGSTEMADAGSEEFVNSNVMVSRQFHACDVILGRYRVIKMVDTNSSDVVYYCFDEAANEHLLLKDLFPDIAVAEESNARFQKVTEDDFAAKNDEPAAPAPMSNSKFKLTSIKLLIL